MDRYPVRVGPHHKTGRYANWTGWTRSAICASLFKLPDCTAVVQVNRWYGETFWREARAINCAVLLLGPVTAVSHAALRGVYVIMYGPDNRLRWLRTHLLHCFESNMKFAEVRLLLIN